ncbi:MAG: hypothetical protein J0I90_06305, partial [Nitrosospira sp.]|nr:hypothetical protein [Nitrosospira sp.]
SSIDQSLLTYLVPALRRTQPGGTGRNFTRPALLAACRACSAARLVPAEIRNHRGSWVQNKY